MATTAKCKNLVVGHVLDQCGGLRVFAEEVLAHVGTVLGLEILVVAINGFVHQLQQLAGFVLGQKTIPFAAPDDLDHVPAGPAEQAFEFLYDFAVAHHRTVEPLQVAVDQETQVVQFFTRGKGKCPAGFRLVHFAVAEERVHPLARRVPQSIVLEVSQETRLID